MEFWLQTSGTWINVATIVVGTIIGLSIGKFFPEKLNTSVMQVLALVTAVLGLSMSQDLSKVSILGIPGVLLALICLVLGTVLGELSHLEEGLELWGERLRLRFKGGGRFTEGFVVSSLLFVIGPMAILGSLQNGLQHDPQTLVIKSSLDGIAAVALASIYGVGVGFSALPILLWQGVLSLAAATLGQVLPHPAQHPVVLLLSGVGGLMILGISCNLLLAGLGWPDKRVRVGAMLPALLVIPVLWGVAQLFS